MSQSTSSSGQAQGSFGAAFEQAEKARQCESAAQQCYQSNDMLGYAREMANAAGYRLMEAMSSGRDEKTRNDLQATVNKWKDQLESEVRRFNESRQGTSATGTTAGTTGTTTSTTTSQTTSSSNKL